MKEHLLSATELYGSGEYLRRNPDWHESDAKWKARQVLTMLSRHGLVPRSVCDIGCGTGGVLAALAEALPPRTELVGFEISADALRHVSAERRRRVNFVQTTPAERDVPFDVALCLDVFEHVPDYLGFLRGLRGVAKQTIFHIPLDISVASLMRAGRLSEVRRQVGHLHMFTKEVALATLETAGFDVVDWSFTNPSRESRPTHILGHIGKRARRVAFHLSPDLGARALGGFPILVRAKPTAEPRSLPAGYSRTYDLQQAGARRRS